MSLRRKTMHLQAVNDEKRLLQGLAATVSDDVMSAARVQGAIDAFSHEFQDRQKKSSATLLRRKLSQTTLKREFQEI
ncbi:hypothetical protein [Serratia liquefaciens]|uniref:hypothetical protein n=1 Tax=Serratia liquefaciens TaxID=614 RepID=UPI0021840DC4|nr:hypothetical protein [Serratia liquefaciens]CAI2494780.1 Uncharacterised protein [Serratia liquefaciens]